MKRGFLDPPEPPMPVGCRRPATGMKRGFFDPPVPPIAEAAAAART